MRQAPHERIILLFCHGGSFNKDSWAPIISRIKVSALLQRVPCELVAYDWRYHGAKHSDTDAATLYYEDGDERLPRVEHPLRHWPEWAPRDLLKLIKLIKNEDCAMNRTTRIVGIGHSMGATSLLKAESLHPGTFEGLVLFEPSFVNGNTYENLDRVASMMVKNTLSRQEEWGSWAEVLEHFKTHKTFRRWHHESLAAFLRGGVVKKSDGKFRLAMPLLQEASIYCQQLMSFTMDQFARVQCRVVFEYGSRTQLFNLPLAETVVEAMPDKYSFGDTLEGLTHASVLEDPTACARHITANLEKLPLFAAHKSRL